MADLTPATQLFPVLARQPFKEACNLNQPAALPLFSHYQPEVSVNSLEMSANIGHSNADEGTPHIATTCKGVWHREILDPTDWFTHSFSENSSDQQHHHTDILPPSLNGFGRPMGSLHRIRHLHLKSRRNSEAVKAKHSVCLRGSTGYRQSTQEVGHGMAYQCVSSCKDD